MKYKSVFWIIIVTILNMVITLLICKRIDEKKLSKKDKELLSKQLANINTRDEKYPYPRYGEDTALDVVVHEYHPLINHTKTEKGDIIHIPINAEFGLSLIDRYFITPVQFFLIRSHSPPPVIAEEYLDRNRLLFTDSYRQKWVEVDKGIIHYRGHIPKIIKKTVVIQCAGNRRKEADSERKVSGTLWRNTSISNAYWEGYSLKHLLEILWGKTYLQYKYIIFTGHDATIYPKEQKWDIFMNRVLGNDVDRIPTDRNGIPCYQVSVAMEKLDDIFLATKMNGVFIPIEHGFPVRVIVPGYIGARGVKWLARIHLSHYPSFGYFNLIDYVSYEPKDKTKEYSIGDITQKIIDYYTKRYQKSMKTKQAKVDHLHKTLNYIYDKYYEGDTGKSIHAFIVQSVITRPIEESRLLEGKNIIRGYAIAYKRITRVRVKLTHLSNKKEEWLEGELYQGDPSNKRPNTNIHTWTWWETNVSLSKGKYQIESIAYTDNSNQLEKTTSWNVRGVFRNDPFVCKVEVV